MGFAKFSGVDEMVIDSEEAAILAGAITEVASHYDIAPDPKMVAWMGLASALGVVYAPRIGAYNMRRKIEKDLKTNGPKQAAPVTNIMAAVADYHPKVS
jgi:hypothetical protein